MTVYSTGTINSASPATDLMTALDAEITSNGWTFVETYTNGTNVTNIYKSPAASNSAGIDFYVGVNRTSTTSNIGFLIGELYDSGTHLWRKYGPAANSSVPDTDYTYVDAVGVLSNSASHARPTNCVISVATSSLFTWYSNVTVNRMIVASSSQGMVYSGIYDSFLENDPLPICSIACHIGSNSSVATSGTSTREPLQTAGSTSNWFVQIPDPTLTNVIAYGYTGNLTSVNLYTGFYPVNGVMFSTSRGDVNRGARGLLKDIVACRIGVVGDTLSHTVGGTTYNFIKPYPDASTIQSIWMPQQ